MPKTKQVATKSSGRGKNIAGSSSSHPITEKPKTSKGKPILAERGFITENPSEGFAATVTALGWEKFIPHRKEFIASVVRDFYKGIKETTDGKLPTVSIVRGEPVKFDIRTINEHFGLGYYGKAIENKQKSYGLAEMNAIKGRICVEGAVWEKSGESGTEFKILKRYLTDEANMWFAFVRHSLYPTTHTLFVDKERLIIIDAIMSRDKVEVGRIINREINKYLSRTDGYLYFPCLITDLCIDACVEIEAEEAREEPRQAFSTKYKPRARPASVSTSVDVQTWQRLEERQNSMAKFVREQFEWQKQVNTYLTKGKMNIPEPVLPEWMREKEEEEEDEDEIPLSTIRLKAVKKEKLKRARSPAKKRQSPAKKKQKKSTSEEEEWKSSDMDPISEEDEEETKRVSMEVQSSEEESETEEKGSTASSSEKTDIQVDSPPEPIRIPNQPPSRTAKPRSPPKPSEKPLSPVHEPSKETHESETPQSKAQNQPKPQKQPSKQPAPTHESQPENPPFNQDLNQPSNPTNSEPNPSQPETEPNVIASEETIAEPRQKPRLRVKHVPKHNPFKRSRRIPAASASEDVSQPMGPEEEVPESVPENPPREKMQVKKKSAAVTGVPATATSGAFVKANVAGPAADAAEVGEDVTTSKELEVGKAQSKPAEFKQPKPVDAAKNQAWEEAKQRVAARVGKSPQDIPSEPAAEVEVSTGAVGSEETTATGAEEDPKKKKKKKQKQESSKPPVRQSGRLRSGVSSK